MTGDGVSLHLDCAGEGRPMVFQHGLCGDCGQPAQVFPAEAGFRRLTLECRGHGSSECGPVHDLSIAQFTDDLAAMIEDQLSGPCVVGGISMGAAVALRLAVIRPDLVTALVLARPAWLVADAPVNMAPNALVGDLLARYPPDVAVTRFEASPIAAELAETAPDNLASLRGFFNRWPLSNTAALLSRISADGPDVTQAELAALRIPVLILVTAEDAIHPIDHGRRLAQMIPGANLVEIVPKGRDRAAHLSAMRSTILHFLKGLPNAAPAL